MSRLSCSRPAHRTRSARSAATIVALALGSLVGPPLLAQSGTHSYEVEDQTVGYSPTTGSGDFTVPAIVTEYPSSPGFPSVSDGFAMGLMHDPGLVTLLEVIHGDGMSDLNGGFGPDFWAPMVLTNGFTLGVVFSFMTPEGLMYDIPQTGVYLHYQTVASSLIGNSAGTSTTLHWTNSLSRVPGSPTVTNGLTVNAATRHPDLLDGTLQLIPTTTLFERGDCNGDSSLDIADAIALLSFLFPVTPPTGPLSCEDACDANDDGTHNVADAIASLGALFGMPPAPMPAPSGACGLDPTDTDPLDCSLPPTC